MYVPHVTFKYSGCGDVSWDTSKVITINSLQSLLFEALRSTYLSQGEHLQLFYHNRQLSLHTFFIVEL